MANGGVGCAAVEASPGTAWQLRQQLPRRATVGRQPQIGDEVGEGLQNEATLAQPGMRQER